MFYALMRIGESICILCADIFIWFLFYEPLKTQKAKYSNLSSEEVKIDVNAAGS